LILDYLFHTGGKVYGHYLDGDGYIIRLSLNKGRASFKSSFIKTREYIEESERDKIMFRSTFRTQRDPSPTKFFNFDVNNAFDLKLKNSANTNAVFWADKLMIFF
jgi:all-trans-8'-apo-beta-carotenal 15,15'-oxygenase